MTSLRGLWQDCAEWDRRYQQEIDRTNMRSNATSMSRENASGPGAAQTAPTRGRHPTEEGST